MVLEMKKIAIAFAFVSAAMGAQAQMYGEIGYTTATAKQNIDGLSIQASPTALRGIVGYEQNPNLALEGLVAFGLHDATIKVNGVSGPNVKFKINNVVGIYLKPKAQLNEQVELFGRVGFVSAKGTTSAPGLGSESNSENSFSYGAGLSYAINPSTSLKVDYMQYLNEDGFKVNGLTFGLGFKF